MAVSHNSRAWRIYGHWRMSAGMPGGGASDGEILDFSTTGVLFVSPIRYEPESTLDMTIWFTPTSSVRCKAHIVRDAERGDGQFLFGARYDGMSLEDRLLLQQMIVDIRRSELQVRVGPPRPAAVPCIG
jgi:hypothetical protein